MFCHAHVAWGDACHLKSGNTKCNRKCGLTGRGEILRVKKGLQRRGSTTSVGTRFGWPEPVRAPQHTAELFQLPPLLQKMHDTQNRCSTVESAPASLHPALALQRGQPKA